MGNKGTVPSSPRSGASCPVRGTATDTVGQDAAETAPPPGVAGQHGAGGTNPSQAQTPAGVRLRVVPSNVRDWYDPAPIVGISSAEGQSVEVEDLDFGLSSASRGRMPGEFVRELLAKNVEMPIVKLVVRRCKLIEVPRELGQLMALRELDLSDNELADLPVELLALINLAKLNLSGNRFKMLPEFIGHLPGLLQLRIENMPTLVLRGNLRMQGTEAICSFLRTTLVAIEESPKELEAHVLQMCNAPDLSDICFLVEGQRIYAHRLILALRIASPLIVSLLASPEREHELEGVRADDFLMLLKLAYSSEPYEGETAPEAPFMQMLKRLQVTAFGRNHVTAEGIDRVGGRTLAQDLINLYRKVVPEAKSEVSERYLPDLLNEELLRHHDWFADVVIRYPTSSQGEGQMASIPTHKLLLFCRSPYFKAKYSSGMMDAAEKVIVLDEYDQDSVQQLIRYLYTDEVVMKQDNVVELLAMSGVYQLERLRSIAEKYIGDNIDHENVLSLLPVADLYQAHFLKMFCTYYVIKHQDALKMTKEWKEFKADHPALYRQLLRLITT